MDEEKDINYWKQKWAQLELENIKLQKEIKSLREDINYYSRMAPDDISMAGLSDW